MLELAKTIEQLGMKRRDDERTNGQQTYMRTGGRG